MIFNQFKLNILKPTNVGFFMLLNIYIYEIKIESKTKKFINGI